MRRKRKRFGTCLVIHLQQLALGTSDLYPSYCHPQTDLPCDVEKIAQSTHQEPCILKPFKQHCCLFGFIHAKASLFARDSFCDLKVRVESKTRDAWVQIPT